MPDRMILLVPAVLILIGLALVGTALSVVLSAWRTYRRGRDPMTHTRPEPLSHAMTLSVWALVVGVVGVMLSSTGLVIALRIVA